jgi:translation initiation factor 2B subunit (eIF-2B alpha/beta/delta family)
MSCVLSFGCRACNLLRETRRVSPTVSPTCYSLFYRLSYLLQPTRQPPQPHQPTYIHAYVYTYIHTYSYRRDVKDMKLLNLVYDLTPADLIVLVITELGYVTDLQLLQLPPPVSDSPAN